MEPAIRELIVQLCSRAGMMMEDASLLGVTMPGNNVEGIRTAVDQLYSDASTILCLVAAAKALTERQR